MMSEWYSLEADAKHISKERARAQKLKASQWWRTKLNQGVCHYCEAQFKPADLTMDHVVPVARGGKSQPGNVVPACRACNASKKLHTPVDLLLGGR
ncbi:MAG TPA: HNH endonuclease [Oligoflexia bacterium]|nr:HNH endonuclease [Oligoflexia bacterium]